GPDAGQPAAARASGLGRGAHTVDRRSSRDQSASGARQCNRFRDAGRHGLAHPHWRRRTGDHHPRPGIWIAFRPAALRFHARDQQRAHQGQSHHHRRRRASGVCVDRQESINRRGSHTRRSREIRIKRVYRLLTWPASFLLVLAACTPPTPAPSPTGAGPRTFTLMTHDSFAVTESLLKTFEADNNVTVSVLKS